MNNDQNQDSSAGVGAVWMMFVMFVGGSIISAVFVILIMLFGMFSFSRVVEDLPTTIPPDFGGGSTPGNIGAPDYSDGYPGNPEPDVEEKESMFGGGSDVVIPDTGLFGGQKLDPMTCKELEAMSNQQAYEMYQEYCL